MFDENQIRLGGETYTISYEFAPAMGIARQWEWSNSSNMGVPKATEQRLNRLFVESWTVDLVDRLTIEQQTALALILQEMGADTVVFHALGLTSPRNTVESSVTNPRPPSGFLKFLGYKVGKNGIPKTERLAALRTAFAADANEYRLHFAPTYFDKWGDPCSQTRKDRIVYLLESSRDDPLQKKNSLAREQWREDLDWIAENLQVVST